MPRLGILDERTYINEREKMLSGELYDASEAELVTHHMRDRKLCRQYKLTDLRIRVGFLQNDPYLARLRTILEDEVDHFLRQVPKTVHS